MNTKIVGFFIGASGGGGGGIDAIRVLGDRFVLKSFDARPDEEHIAPVCFWSSPGPHTFYLNRTRASSSLLPANPEAMDYLQENDEPWRSEAELVDTTIFSTVTLDEYCETTGLWPDFLTMDIQGAEYEVLQGGPKALRTLLAIVTEVEFKQIYQGQKLFADIDALLKTASFQFIKLYSPQYWRLNPGDGTKTLTVAEALFMRSPEGLDEASKIKLAELSRCFGVTG